MITKKQQAALSRAHVLVCGCGGMGGVAAEVLVRMGIGGLTLVDHDRFEATNANRQIHCNRDTLGQLKAKVLRRAFLKINPRIEIFAYAEPVSLENVNKIITGADVVVNGMDKMHASICLEREARRRGIPIVDAWITPFASVFTMRPEDPHWEDFLNFPTRGKPENEISERDCRQALRKEIDFTFSHFDPYSYVKKKLINGIITDRIQRPSLAPVVWLSGVLMANEVFKIIAGYKEVGPAGIFYDQYTHRISRGKVDVD